MRKQIRDLSDKERIETLDALYTAASSLSGREQMKAFLRELLTESERIMLGRRILIAQRLLKGEPVVSIAENMQVGIDTVYRIKRWLDKSFSGGYANAVSEMEKKMANRLPGEKSSFDRMKKKYPLHFLLFNIYDDLKKGRGSGK